MDRGILKNAQNLNKMNIEWCYIWTEVWYMDLWMMKWTNHFEQLGGVSN